MRGLGLPAAAERRRLLAFLSLPAEEAARALLGTVLVRRRGGTVRAARIVETEVYPALRRQAALLRRALDKAPAAAGVWRLPEGERYYRHAVRASTTTDLSGEEIHRLGLDLVKRFSAAADAISTARQSRSTPTATMRAG